MKLLLVSILLLLSFNKASAQSGYFNDSKGKDFNDFLVRQIRPMPIIMENCLMPFTYAKFKITKENTVDSLIVTNESVEDVKNEISRVIMLSNGQWNIEQAANKWFIVPIIFYTNYNKNFRGKGCDFKKILADQNKEMNYKNTETNAIYFPTVLVQSSWN